MEVRATRLYDARLPLAVEDKRSQAFGPSLQPPKTMKKYMSSHSVPAGALSRGQIDQIAQAAQQDPVVKPYRSFLNLSEGKIVCVMEAPDEAALANWFKKMQMPCDSITAVEFEGDCGVVSAANGV